MEVVEMFLVGLFVFIILKIRIYDPLMNYWNNGSTISEKLMALLQSQDFQVFLIALALILIVIFSIWLRIKILRKRDIKLRETRQRLDEESRVMGFTKRDIQDYNSEELEKFIDGLNNIKISKEAREACSFEIKHKLVQATHLLEKGLHDEEIYRHQKNKERILEETKSLRQERYEEEIKSQRKKELLLERLNPEETLIYDKRDLRDEEAEVLKKNDFRETNEYDPIENKYLTFLVRKILNHSATHSFLVERIRQLLEQHIPSDKIKRHDTKDADLTFQINHKIYALEIETGTGLTKKKSLGEKVNLLNNKYGLNWYFVVSNRNLAKKYREYGKVTLRKGVCNLIEKLLRR